MSGEKLRALRKKRKMTRKEFSEWSLIPYETIRNWEHNRREMKPWQVKYIELLDKEPKTKG